MRIVVLTGSFFLANVAGLLYGKGFSVSRLAAGILILLSIGLNKVNTIRQAHILMAHTPVALIRGTTQGHTEWSPGLQACLPSYTDQFRWSIMINFVEDSVLLAVMLFGVLRMRNATHLWELLYLQGLFWIPAAVLTELPAVVCPCL